MHHLLPSHLWGQVSSALREGESWKSSEYAGREVKYICFYSLTFIHCISISLVNQSLPYSDSYSWCAAQSDLAKVQQCPNSERSSRDPWRFRGLCSGCSEACLSAYRLSQKLSSTESSRSIQAISPPVCKGGGEKHGLCIQATTTCFFAEHNWNPWTSNPAAESLATSECINVSF